MICEREDRAKSESELSQLASSLLVKLPDGWPSQWGAPALQELP